MTDLTGSGFIERELTLIKVKAPHKNKSEIIQLTEIFGGKIVSVHKNELGIELSGEACSIENFLKLMDDFGIIEVARTGRVAISRDAGVTEDYSNV